MFCVCSFYDNEREASQTVMTIKSTRKVTDPGEAEQHVKDMQRMLARAEQKISKLQEKIADQKQQLRAFQAQAKHEDNLAAEREDLKAEITDLKGEIRELTRANREQVEKIETLRVENVKLRAGSKVQKPNGMSDGANVRVLRPALS
jgi:predicted RNase H-like nuclease (RuvC/YqgF family)